jgi:hypothetical protein
MTTRYDYLEAVDNLVGGEIPLGEGEKGLALDLAVKEHSRYRPQVIAEDVTGDGGFDYALSDLASWSEGFSAIQSVEYPVDDDDENADILQEEQWQIYRKPAGRVLRLLEDTPETDEEIRITYTALHTCTDSTCTVETIDEEAVQALASGYFCSMLATYYAQSTDSTIAADSVDHKSKSQEYAARSRALRKVYFDHLGIKEGQRKPASVTRDQDTMPSWRADHLTHKRRHR